MFQTSCAFRREDHKTKLEVTHLGPDLHLSPKPILSVDNLSVQPLCEGSCIDTRDYNAYLRNGEYGGGVPGGSMGACHAAMLQSGNTSVRAK